MAKPEKSEPSGPSEPDQIDEPESDGGEDEHHQPPIPLRPQAVRTVWGDEEHRRRDDQDRDPVHEQVGIPGEQEQPDRDDVEQECAEGPKSLLWSVHGRAPRVRARCRMRRRT